jgi:hypothetical protein
MGQAMNKQIGRGPAHLWLSNALAFPHSIINGFSSFVISQETIIKKGLSQSVYTEVDLYFRKYDCLMFSTKFPISVRSFNSFIFCARIPSDSNSVIVSPRFRHLSLVHITSRGTQHIIKRLNLMS